MKRVIFGFFSLLIGVSQAISGDSVAGGTEQSTNASIPYAVAERGPHHRVWERVEYEMTPFGTTVPKIHRYTELATGMHYQKDGLWIESKEIIEPLPDGAGAAASQGQHKVIFPPNLSGGIIEMSTPDDKWLRSRVLGLSYFDTATGKSVLLAELKDSVGQIVGDNQIVYPSTFTDFTADVRYTYRLRGFEQDVILHERPPLPEKFGLSSATTRLQVLTEFLSAPEPIVKTAELKTKYGTLNDNRLDFGAMRMGRGSAFRLGDESAAEVTSARKVPVGKQWLWLDGRQILVEEVAVPAIAADLDELPTPKKQARLKPTKDSVRYLVSNKRLLPTVKSAKRTKQPMRTAKLGTPQAGLVLDYQILSGATDFTFQSDTTYYCTNGVVLYGTTTIEGGTVVKFSTNTAAKIYIDEVLNCDTAPYRVAVFTAKDDNTVGENISGSTGNPSGYYGGAGLYLWPQNHVKYLRVSRLRAGFENGEGDTSTFSDVQLVKCQRAFVGTEDSVIQIANSLITEVENVVYGALRWNVVGNHLTVDRCDTFATSVDTEPGSASSFYLTNSLLTSVTNWTDNAYVAFTTNTTIWLSNNSGIYQTVGAATHYLTTNSPYRNAGTTNLSPDLIASLGKKTTYPPLVYVDETYEGPATLGPQAQRDTDVPDLGYHYNPLDYAFGATTVTNDLTFSAGTAVAWFRTDANQDCGIYLNDRQRLVFDGTVESPCYFVRNNTVQEQANSLWTAPPGPGAIEGSSMTAEDNAEIVMRFTKCSAVNIDQNYFQGYFGSIKASLINSEFSAGALSWWFGSVGITNCFLDRQGRVGIEAGWGGYLALHNCTMRGGTLYLNRWENSGDPGDLTGLTKVSILDTVFDRVDVQSDGDFPRYDTNWTRFDYNAFLYGEDRTDPTGPHDVIVTNSFNWQTSWLGDFYLPTNSTLINAGSLTNASLAGLYHFTTQTNQVKETNSWLDIGYHYVAVGLGGDPVDTDEDGTPDYLEDTNGNGVFDSWTFETPWMLPENGLKLWLRADAGVTNNSVNRWSDQTTNHYDAIQNTTGSRPTLTTNVINGLPVVRFDGSSDYLDLTNFLTGFTQAEVFVFLKTTTNLPSSNQGLWWLGQPSAAWYPASINNGGWIGEGFGRTNLLINTGTPFQRVDQFHLYDVSAQVGAWSSRINGKLHYTTTNGAVAFTSTPQLGQDGNTFNPRYFDGDIAEVLVFNRVLSAGERDGVGVYLNQKYAWSTNVVAAPTGLSAKPLATNQISLWWTNVLGNSTVVYQIERKTGAGNYSQIATIRDATSYLDTNVVGSTTYTYRAKGWSYAGLSDYSPEVTVVTPNSGVGLPLADLKLWLKADSGVVRNNTNGTVGSWIDQSGNGNNATTLYLSDQPQWLTNSASGGPAVRFDGVSDHFILPGFLTGATQAEAYVILRAATNLPSSSRGLWRFGPQSGASSYYPHYNGHIYDSFGSTINRDLGIPLHRADEFHLYNANAGAAQWNSWINGRSFYTTNVNTVSFPSDPMIGDAWNSEFAGDMVEVMIFKRGLSIEERCSVGRYLNYKYQFANSPPSSVRATAQSSTQLSISWNDNGSLDPTSYTVDRKTGATGSYLQIAAVTNGFLCLDSSVVPGTNYYYRVTGSNFFGDSFSTEISPPTVTITNPPSGTTIVSSTNLVIGASAFDSDGTVTQVQFFEGSLLLGTAPSNSSAFTFNWTNAFPTPHVLTAEAWDNAGNSRISSANILYVAWDTDGDGYSDAQEIANGTNPFVPDAPWQPPAPDPSDHTPPTIFLDEPSNATLLP